MSNNNKNNNELTSWILPIILLCIFPPVGVFLLVVKLFGLGGSRSRNNGGVKRHPADLSQAQNEADHSRGYAQSTAPVQMKKGRKKSTSKQKDLIPSGQGFIIAGAICTAVFGMASVSVILEALFWLPNMAWFLEETVPVLCFFAASAGMLLYGLKQRRKGRRFRKYLSLIGKRSQVDLNTMAEVGSIRKKVLCDDLQEMLDRGILPVGYLDLLADRLVLTDEGVPERMAPPPQPESTGDLSREDAILAEIRQLNDDIAQPQLSAQIDEIEEITRKIFQQLKDNPAKAPQLRSFLNYYLPTTLKILHAYAQLESQGIEGDNITAAKARIEGMMDKVVEGFEKQLDKLFEHDAMDITTDVAVLEKMLTKDGLSGGQGMQLGC